jgi:hypothetical protein
MYDERYASLHLMGSMRSSGERGGIPAAPRKIGDGRVSTLRSRWGRQFEYEACAPGRGPHGEAAKAIPSSEHYAQAAYTSRGSTVAAILTLRCQIVLQKQGLLACVSWSVGQQLTVTLRTRSNCEQLRCQIQRYREYPSSSISACRPASQHHHATRGHGTRCKKLFLDLSVRCPARCTRSGRLTTTMRYESQACRLRSSPDCRTVRFGWRRSESLLATFAMYIGGR